MLAASPSVGVVNRATGELLTGCGVHAHGGLGLLFTLADYRRRGFGRLVVAELTRQLVAGGAVPFADVATRNQASRKLFESLGYVDIGLAAEALRPLTAAKVYAVAEPHFVHEGKQEQTSCALTFAPKATVSPESGCEI
jgi:GNAT superfamily N-acetyltransferase